MVQRLGSLGPSNMTHLNSPRIIPCSVNPERCLTITAKLDARQPHSLRDRNKIISLSFEEEYKLAAACYTIKRNYFPLNQPAYETRVESFAQGLDKPWWVYTVPSYASSH
jgi:hypothetical protein